jgi:hypothetical protein
MESRRYLPVVLAPFLADASLFLHFTEYPIEVVRFNFHLLGDLRGGDAGVLLYQGNCLVGASTAAATPAAFSGSS